jgi:hypothetical protein
VEDALRALEEAPSGRPANARRRSVGDGPICRDRKVKSSAWNGSAALSVYVCSHAMRSAMPLHLPVLLSASVSLSVCPLVRLCLSVHAPQ